MKTEECGVPLEYLNKGATIHWHKRFMGKKYRSPINGYKIEKVFEKIVRLRTTENGTFCFKAHWSQFKPFRERIREMTQGSGIDKIVWISRRDQLSQAISKVIAQQTGVWISGAMPKRKPTYSYAAIVRAADEHRYENMQWRAFLSERYQGRYVSVVYEDLVSNEEARSELAAFLGIGKKLESSERTIKLGSRMNENWKSRFLGEISERDRWIINEPEWLQSVI